MFKHVYGLKQAGAQWYERLCIYLREEVKGIPNDMDPCLLRVDGCRWGPKYKNEHGLLVIYVDDIVVVSTTADFADKIICLIGEEFEMSDTSQPNSINMLGVRIKQNPETGAITLDHSDHIRKLVSEYGVSFENKHGKRKSPGVPKVRLSENVGPTIDVKEYQQLVGKLQYLANATRPDIAYCTNSCARFTNNPGKEHWAACRRILEYLGATTDYHIRYANNENTKITINGWSDADWFGFTDGYSIGGSILTVAGGPVMWASNKQKIVARSTAEAEFIAAATTYRLMKWLSELYEDSQIEYNIPHLIMDSTCAINAITTNCTGKRVRFINLRYRYLCHGYTNKEFVVRFVKGS
jgi:hypothetical protein